MVSTRSMFRSKNTVSASQPVAVSKKKKRSSRRSRHKNPSRRMMELRSRRKIRNAGPDLSTVAAITTANSLTLLLRLPQEIKNCIYERVLGGNLLHIKRDLFEFKRSVAHSTKGAIKERRFTNQICCSPISEEDALYHFDMEDDSSFYVQNIELRHLDCGSFKHKGSALAPLKLNINLLHACRQIYNEARFVPYSANTFSFDTPRNLRALIHTLVQHGVNINSAFRSLRLDLTNHDLPAWTQAFNAVSQHMTLLETVYINVDQKPKWSPSADAEQKKAAMRPVLDCLAILGKTPAKSTMIVVSDRFLSSTSSDILTSAHPTWITHRWTLDEKRKWVKRVKLAIQDMQFFG